MDPGKYALLLHTRKKKKIFFIYLQVITFNKEINEKFFLG